MMCCVDWWGTEKAHAEEMARQERLQARKLRRELRKKIVDDIVDSLLSEVISEEILTISTVLLVCHVLISCAHTHTH
jgi:hypothetical protein